MDREAHLRPENESGFAGSAGAQIPPGLFGAKTDSLKRCKELHKILDRTVPEAESYRALLRLHSSEGGPGLGAIGKS